MANQEDAIRYLFLQELRSHAGEIGRNLSKKDVVCLSDGPCLGAFVNEWTIARLAWIDQLSGGVTKPALHLALKSGILDAVITYDGLGKIKFDDYKWLIFSEDPDSPSPPTPGSLFLSGLNDRLSRIPRKPPRRKLTPHEETEVMLAVINSCWAAGFDLNSTLEAFRPQATAELIGLM